MNLNILSVDWDYFFPCLDYFDWGHSEARHHMIFAEVLWQARAAQPVEWGVFPPVKKFTDQWRGKTIMDYVQPDKLGIQTFWDRVLYFDVARLLVCETHQDMHEVFKNSSDKLTVYNFDAHHDAGYENEQGKPPDCGNWALKLREYGILNDYKLIYPEWRRSEPERGKPPDWVDINYGMVRMPPTFDYVFVCRSSVWTPSWADEAWLEFVDGVKDVADQSHEVPYAVEKRAFDYNQSLIETKKLEEFKNGLPQ